MLQNIDNKGSSMEATFLVRFAQLFNYAGQISVDS